MLSLAAQLHSRMEWCGPEECPMPLNAIACVLFGALHELPDLQVQHLILPVNCCSRSLLPSTMHCSKATARALT